MKKRIPALAVLWILALVTTAAAGDIVEIPLPGLVGSYPPNPAEVIVTVQHDFEGRTILGGKIHLVGTVTVGRVDCLDGTSSTYPMDVGVWLGDDYQTAYRAFGFVGDDAGLSPGETVDFDELRTLVAGSQSTGWGFLEDGEAPLDFLFAPPAIVGICGVGIYPSGTITEATLLVELEPSVPNADSSWSAVKARY